nr:hypothetical protein CFP56_57026 [Quercus suber]
MTRMLEYRMGFDDLRSRCFGLRHQTRETAIFLALLWEAWAGINHQIMLRITISSRLRDHASGWDRCKQGQQDDVGGGKKVEALRYLNEVLMSRSDDREVQRAYAVRRSVMWCSGIDGPTTVMSQTRSAIVARHEILSQSTRCRKCYHRAVMILWDFGTASQVVL